MSLLQRLMVSLQKTWSYILPFNVKKFHSPINGDMQVNFINGRKRLDAKNSNYSFGSITEILHQWLKTIAFDANSHKRILLLWLGGGSVISTIREIFVSEAYIEIVDIDPYMIAIAKSEFGLERFKNIHIIQGDALAYIRDTQSSFDLIIIDIFINNVTPDIFTQKEFIENLVHHLWENGNIIFNMMRKTMETEWRERIQALFLEQWLEVKILEQVQDSNDLVIGTKPHTS